MTVEYREMLAALQSPPLTQLLPPSLTPAPSEKLANPNSAGVMWSTTALPLVEENSCSRDTFWKTNSNKSDSVTEMFPDLDDIDLSHTRELLTDSKDDDDLDFLLDTVVRGEVPNNDDIALSSPASSSLELTEDSSPASPGAQATVVTPDAACPDSGIPLTALQIAGNNGKEDDIIDISFEEDIREIKSSQHIVTDVKHLPPKRISKKTKSVLNSKRTTKQSQQCTERPARQIPPHMLSVQTCGQHNHSAPKGRPVFCPSIMYPTIRQELENTHAERVTPIVIDFLKAAEQMEDLRDSDSKSEASTHSSEYNSLKNDDDESCSDSDSSDTKPKSDRLERRRYNNRVAAQRCRQRKREHASTLKKEIQTWECNNTKLRYEIHVLQKQLDLLTDVWEDHKEICSTNKTGLSSKKKRKHKRKHKRSEKKSNNENEGTLLGQEMTTSLTNECTEGEKQNKRNTGRGRKRIKLSN